MGLINKGRIASISGNTARVVPVDSASLTTAKITIPWHLRGSGDLKKGTVVVYAEFADSTGLLIGRADGIGESGGGSGNGISDITIIEIGESSGGSGNGTGNGNCCENCCGNAISDIRIIEIGGSGDESGNGNCCGNCCGNAISDITIIEIESKADNDGGNESNNEGVST